MQVRQEVDSSGWAWLRITVCILQGYSERYTTEALSGPPLLMAQACPSAACRCSYHLHHRGGGDGRGQVRDRALSPHARLATPVPLTQY
jgi:hypothetical protein